MATTRTKTPIGELGAPGITASLDGWLDTGETTPELRWPTSVRTYDAMRNDSHIEGCLDAITLPIERSHWDLDPDTVVECRPEVVAQVRSDLDLPEEGKRLIRPRNSVDFDDFLRQAVSLELVYGHMLFEQVYELDAGLAHLRKLAPRMPSTILGWDLDRYGGLQAVKQLVPRPNGMWDEVVLPIDRLVVFTRRKEGSDPTGRSILRSCYLNWHLKQKMIRIDAIAADRHGTGVVQFDYDPNEISETKALDIAKNVRVGEYAGLAIAQGHGDLQLKGVDGQLHDTLSSIRYHDQEMARRMLAMFLDLGHDNGARSLGDTFVDFFVTALQATANHLEQVINEHVIRDLVELNYGPNEPYPLVRCDEITADVDLTAEALKALADGGYLIPDPQLEEWMRRRLGMPAPVAGRPAQSTVPASDNDAEQPTLEQLQAKLSELKAGPRAVPSRP